MPLAPPVTNAVLPVRCYFSFATMQVRGLSGLHHIDRCLSWWRWLRCRWWCTRRALQDHATALVGAAGLWGEWTVIHRLLACWWRLLCRGLGQGWAAGQGSDEGDGGNRTHGGGLFTSDSGRVTAIQQRAKNHMICLTATNMAAMVCRSPSSGSSSCSRNSPATS